MSERAVEVPIIWNIVQKYQEKKILEVGNVLSHYYSVNHDILDKYEKSNGVINQDVVDFRPTKKYDLIVSISTLEHIGWDENIRNNAHEPKKILFTIENLIRCLTPEGKLVFTSPIGQNPNMDKILRKKKIKCTSLYCLKRISTDNKWIETDWEDTKDSQYDKPFISANGLAIGTISNNHKNSE
jgi:cyclopropane fatty-acyl-phospholipid synthase-like methyltransferase